MISFPIWRNERMLNSLADPLNYYITFNDATIYSGRAHVRPGGYYVEIPIDRIIRDYLENTMDVEYDGVYGQPGNYGVFNVYQTGTDIHLAEYGVLLNCQDEWSGQTMVLADTVNGHLDPRMRFFWSKYNTGQTTEVITTEDIYYFSVEDYVNVAWDAGIAFVNVNTNYPYQEIHAICPEGVRELRYGSQYAFSVPVNWEETAKSYVIQWYRRGVLLGETTIFVGAVVWEFTCDQYVLASASGGTYTINYTTNIPASRLTASLPTGWELVSLGGGKLVFTVPRNATGSALTQTVYFLNNGDTCGSCTVTQPFENWFVAPQTVDIDVSGGTFNVVVDTSYPLSAITPSTTGGLVYDGYGTSLFRFTASANTGASSRSFSITYVYGHTVLGTTVVRQAGSAYLDASEIPVRSEGGLHTVPITTNITDLENVQVVLPPNVTLVGYNSTGYTFNFPVYGGADPRSFTITFMYDGDVLDTITLYQEGNTSAGKYLTLKFNENSTVRFTGYSGMQLWYSVDNGPWTYRPGTETVPDSSATISFAKNSEVRFYGNYRSQSQSPHQLFESPGETTGAQAIVYGNLLSLSDGIGFSGTTQTNDLAYIFRYQPITDASGLQLPTQLIEYGLCRLFGSCSLLRVPPALPAMSIPGGAYQAMFWECTSLETAPALPATSLGDHAYAMMFYGCTSLKTAPQLNATDFNYGSQAFLGHQYDQMFYGCTSLVSGPPSLPATSLPQAVYEDMFAYCTSLVNIPPELPSLSAGQGVYRRMFFECTSLKKGPIIYAKDLYYQCFMQMFRYCSSLEEITVYADTNQSGPNYKPASYWMDSVPATGTAYVGGSYNWPRSVDGIPAGWTIVTI